MSELKPADSEFLDRVIDVANTLRFASFVARKPGLAFRPLEDGTGFSVGDVQGSISFRKVGADLHVQMDPDPENGGSFSPVLVVIDGQMLGEAPFMKASTTVVDGRAPDMLAQFADAYDEIQSDGVVSASAYDDTVFGVIAENVEPRRKVVAAAIEDLCRGIDRFAAIDNAGFVMFIRSPALGAEGSIVPANYEGTPYRLPADDKATPGQLRLLGPLRLAQRMAHHRPKALMVRASDASPGAMSVSPLAYAYRLPDQGQNAMIRAKEAYDLLVDYEQEVRRGA